MSQTTIEKLAVELSLEAKGFDKQIKSIDRAIKQSEREFKQAGRGIKDYEKTYVGLDNKIKSTAKQLDLYTVKLNKQKEEYTKLEGVVTKQKSKLEQLEATVGKGSSEWQKQSQLVQKNSEKLNKLGNDIKKTEGNVDNLSSELKASQTEFENLGNKTKTASEKLEEIDRKADLAESGFESLGAELQQNGSLFNKLENDMNKLSSSIDSNNQRIKVYEAEIEQLNGKLTANSQEHNRLENEIAQTERALTKAKSSYGENSNEVNELKLKLYGLKDTYNLVETEIDQNEKELAQYKTAVNKAKAEVTNLSAELKRMPFEEVGNKLKDTGSKVKGVGQSFTTGITMPVAAAGVAAGKMAYDYDQGLAKVGSLVDKSGKEMREYDDIIKNLSRSTGVSLDDLTESMYQGISAGGDLGNVFQLTETASKLAIGGFTDTETAIDGLTSTMNAFGMKYEDVDKVANKFILTQNKGKTSVGELANSIGQVAPTANAAGVKVDELLSAVAALTMNGLKTSESMTSLKAALSNVIKPSTEAQKLAKKLGLEFNIAGLQSKGFAGFLEDVKKKTGGNVETMGKLFGSTEALNAMLLLTGEGNEKFTSTLESMGGELDLVDTAFNGMKDSAGAQLQDSFNKLKVSLMELGEALAPVILFLAEKISELAEWFSGLDEQTQKNIVTFALLAAAIGPILVVVGSLIMIGGNLVTLLGGIGGATAATTATTGGLTGALGVLAGPVGIGLAIGALVGLMAYVGDSESSILKLQEKFGGLGYVIGSVCEFISGVVQITFGNLIITVTGVFDILAALMDGPGGQTVGDAWDRMNAKLTLNTEEAMGKITTTTSRGMSQMRAMSEESLTGLVTTTDLLLKQIPTIAEGNYADASTKIAGQLTNMDATQLLTLQGMNDTTKAMFQGINSSMSVAEMSNQVEWNLKQMHTAGALEVSELEKDVTGSMDILKKQVDSKTKEAATKAGTNTSDLKNKVDSNTKNASTKADSNTKNLANNVDSNTKSAATKADANTKNLGARVDANIKTTGSNTDSNTKNITKSIDNNTKDASKKADANTKEIPKAVDKNTKEAAKKADDNTKKLATEVNDNSKEMKNKATSNANSMKNNVTSATSSMASKAINDWQRVRNEYSKGINGRVNITKTTTNVSRQTGAKSIGDMTRAVDINSFKTQGEYFSSKSPESISVKESNVNIDLRNIEKMIARKNNDTNINVTINLENVEIKNDDNYQDLARKLGEYVSVELQKIKINTKKSRGGNIVA